MILANIFISKISDTEENTWDEKKFSKIAKLDAD